MCIVSGFGEWGARACKVYCCRWQRDDFAEKIAFRGAIME